MTKETLPEVGSTYKGHEVIEGHFCGLPLGRIKRGPNKGHTVILTSFKVKGMHR